MNNVNEKLTELLDLLSEQEEVKRFKLIEAKLKDNPLVQEKIALYKKMQQKVVLYEQKNDDLPNLVEDKLDRLYDDLFNIPIYNEFSLLQSEINDIIKEITGLIEASLNEDLEEKVKA
jgi:cell fate (sporulation/competence/biofilm development) regulator YmcA (YheA/YmcA/DUF963 family)